MNFRDPIPEYSIFKTTSYQKNGVLTSTIPKHGIFETRWQINSVYKNQYCHKGYFIWNWGWIFETPIKMIFLNYPLHRSGILETSHTKNGILETPIQQTSILRRQYIYMAFLISHLFRFYNWDSHIQKWLKFDPQLIQKWPKIWPSLY